MMADLKVVALGGGHGLYASLSAMRYVTRNLTAVVTVADDGGSSGRLREELGCLPPGDLRMALAALCDDSEWGHTWRDLLQYRFETDGPLDQHAVGNLLISALWEQLDDPVAGLDLVARLLQARGRVLPMALQPLEIAALMERDGVVTEVHGQVNVAVAPGNVQKIWLTPSDPVVCPEAVAAIAEADAVVLGPGSWYTSVLPHLMLPELRAAIVNSPAQKIVTMNLVPQAAETEGMTALDHLAALSDVAPELRVTTVIGDPMSIEDLDEVEAAVARLDGRLLLRQVHGQPVAVHDPLRLAAAYRDALEGSLGDVGRRHVTHP